MNFLQTILQTRDLLFQPNNVEMSRVMEPFKCRGKVDFIPPVTQKQKLCASFLWKHERESRALARATCYTPPKTAEYVRQNLILFHVFGKINTPIRDSVLNRERVTSPVD